MGRNPDPYIQDFIDTLNHMVTLDENIGIYVCRMTGPLDEQHVIYGYSPSIPDVKTFSRLYLFPFDSNFGFIRPELFEQTKIRFWEPGPSKGSMFFAATQKGMYYIKRRYSHA